MRPVFRNIRSRLKNIAGKVSSPLPARAGTTRFKRCVIHIGGEKTGTTTIQKFLVDNRKAFAKEGVMYPASSGQHGGSQWEFAASAHPEAWKTDIGLFLGARTEAAMAELKTGFNADLVREMSRFSRPDTLLVSSEHLQSRLQNPELIGNLREYLLPFCDTFEIIMYIRRQDRVASSLYATKVKSGNPKPDVFPKMPKNRLRYFYDYDQIYDNWCAVFGAANVRLRIFHPDEFIGNDLISDFCDIAGLSLAGKSMQSGRENISLSRVAAQFLTEVNQQIPNIVDGQRNAERDFLAQEISRLFPGKFRPALRNEAEEFASCFAVSNERLRKKAFPERTKPLFDSDFSEYRESLDETEPTYQEAVSVAIQLWRSAHQQDARVESPEQTIPEAIPSATRQVADPKLPANGSTARSLDKPAATAPTNPVQEADAGPLVSIVMPSFNQREFIQRSIDSVLQQDYPQLELLVQDGGSTDGTVELLTGLAASDPRVRWISEPDSGPADAINKALARARGTLIGWLNSDDMYTASAISRAVQAFAAHPDWIMVYGRGQHVDAHDQVLTPYPTQKPDTPVARFSAGCFICQPTVFFKKSMHGLLGPMDTELRAAFDFDYWLRAFLKFQDRIGFIDQIQAQSRLHDACITRKERARVAVEGIKVISRHLGEAPIHWFSTYADELMAQPAAERNVENPRQHLLQVLEQVKDDLPPEDVRAARQSVESILG